MENGLLDSDSSQKKEFDFEINNPINQKSIKKKPNLPNIKITTPIKPIINNINDFQKKENSLLSEIINDELDEILSKEEDIIYN